MTIIELVEAERRVVEWLTKERHRLNRAAGVHDAQISDGDWYDLELNGFASEFAFARAFNIYPDMTTSPRKGGYDCLLHSGIRVDVKWVRRTTDHLLATLKKAEDDQIDVFALVQGTFPRYAVGTWAWYEELVNDATINDFGHGPTYSLPQGPLRDEDELRVLANLHHSDLRRMRECVLPPDVLARVVDAFKPGAGLRR